MPCISELPQADFQSSIEHCLLVTCEVMEESSCENQCRIGANWQCKASWKNCRRQLLCIKNHSYKKQGICMAKSSKVDPDNVDATHLLGVLDLQSGDNVQALERLSKASRLNPTAVNILSNLGTAQRRLGKFRRGVEDLSKSDLHRPQAR